MKIDREKKNSKKPATLIRSGPRVWESNRGVALPPCSSGSNVNFTPLTSQYDLAITKWLVAFYTRKMCVLKEGLDWSKVPLLGGIWGEKATVEGLRGTLWWLIRVHCSGGFDGGVDGI